MEPSTRQADVDISESGEIQLVRRAQDGDIEAFADLVRQYQRRAVSVAYRLLGNAEDASDVSQDAFLRAHRHLSQLQDPSRFGPWLMRTVSNLALNFRRGRAMRAARPIDDSLDAAPVMRNPGTGRPVVADSGDGPLPEELRDAVTAAMEQLPDKQRLALVLFSVEGMPQKEVADILDCSVELVKWNVFQARKKLKDLLAEHL